MAFMYETCDEDNDEDDGGMHSYLYGPPPKEIEKYIAEFGRNDGSPIIWRYIGRSANA